MAMVYGWGRVMGGERAQCDELAKGSAWAPASEPAMTKHAQTANIVHWMLSWHE